MRAASEHFTFMAMFLAYLAPREHTGGRIWGALVAVPPPVYSPGAKYDRRAAPGVFTGG